MTEKYCSKCEKMTKTRINSVGNVECLKCFINGIDGMLSKPTIDYLQNELKEIKEIQEQNPISQTQRIQEEFERRLQNSSLRPEEQKVALELLKEVQNE